jgi:glycogen synthase
LPLVRQPVFTVSDQFALDFTEEILQAEVMAPHLRGNLLSKLIGIPNGLFTEVAVDSQALNAARRGDFSALDGWKAANRGKFLQALDNFQPSAEEPLWGDLRKFQRDAVPWFVLAGRDDPRQKGYDVACQAIASFLEAGGRGQFLFFPIPGDEGLEGLAFLQRLVQAFPERVLALPFIFKEGFFSALRGSSFGIMPSFYEPFGMANEFYLNGSIGIARATGGLVQQIVPLRAAASFSHAVQTRIERYFSTDAHPSGILYRERDGLPSAVNDWRGINAAEYRTGEGRPNRVEQRQNYPLFCAMAEELCLALKDAGRLYDEQPALYYRMLVAGIDHIVNNFSWERAAQSYLRYLDR